MLGVVDLTKIFIESGKRRPRGRRVWKRAETQIAAVDGVSLEVNAGEVLTLLGPSGCGKTTVLRSIAGLERPNAGTIALGKRTLFSSEERINVPANDRGLGMVFQSYAIWPHMDVYRNVAFPLQVNRRRRKMGLSQRDIRERVEGVLEIAGLSPMISRSATQLSGGQQQRLALARALVTEPDLMLLDEPLSNLDAKLREVMRLEFIRLQQRLGLTAIYVTHDQAEALALSDVIAVMREGKIVQRGKPKDIYERPNCQFVAEFIGSSNLLPGTVASVDGGMLKVQTDQGEFWAANDSGLRIGGRALVNIRPEDLRMDASSRSQAASNGLCGIVTNQVFLGDTVDHVVEIGQRELRCRSNPSMSIEPGNEVCLHIPPDRIRVLPAEDMSESTGGG